MSKINKLFKQIKFMVTHRIKIKCHNCFEINRLNEEMILKSRIEYGGPFCTECGSKLIFKTKKTDSPASQNQSHIK